MNPLVLERTVIICLVGACVCFAYNSSAIQMKEPDRRSRSTIPPDNIVPEEGFPNMDNNTDARTVPKVPLFERLRNEHIDTKLPVQLENLLKDERFKLPWYGVTNTFEKGTNEDETEMFDAKTLHENNDWMSSFGKLDIPWNNHLTRENFISRCITDGVSPQLLFDFMDVHLPHFPNDAQSIDPKVFVWFEFIIHYRPSQSNNNADIPDIPDIPDTASSHTEFNDEELLKFLMNKYSLQRISLEMTPLLAEPQKPHPYVPRQVAILFDVIRRDDNEALQELAENMQNLMLSHSETKEYVLDAWLLSKETPEVAWGIFFPDHKPGINDFNLVTLWLRYVDLYCNEVHSSSVEFFFSHDNIYDFLTKKLSIQQMTAVLSSKEFKDLVSKYHISSTVWTSWNRSLLTLHTTPEQYITYLLSPPKSTLDDINLMPALRFIKLYRMQTTFTSQMIFDLFNGNVSRDRLISLFREAEMHSGLEDLAREMLEYIDSRWARGYMN
ncbi:hypothetical protein Plhal304r1_c016g0059061 [Plasmopara halstedii]